MTTATATRYVNQFALLRGVKITRKAAPGVWQVLRESERTLNGRETVRAREVDGAGELVGPVRHVWIGEVAEILG